jgi:hypothetical protein
VGGVLQVAVSSERAQRLGERPGWPGEIAGRQRHLRLCREAARAFDRLPRSEAPSRPSQQLTRPPQVTELRHRDAPQRERRRIVPQGDELERAERIARA